MCAWLPIHGSERHFQLGNMAQIQPFVIPIAGTANNFYLRSLPFDMEGTTCSFYYELQDTTQTTYGIEPKVIYSGNLEMDAIDFNQWGADNQYCIEWAANKLGITLI